LLVVVLDQEVIVIGVLEVEVVLVVIELALVFLCLLGL
jgi:hypothetical protein|tara:strand:- start:617 stop:730 length:114 start_codon:yes stop_codon:yes gene_type:complete